MPSVANLEPTHTIGAGLRHRLAGFVRTLRDNGFAVGLAETRDALAVLASPAATQPALLGPALRSLLCSTHSDWERFDALFAAYWLGRSRRRSQRVVDSPTGKRIDHRNARSGSPRPMGATAHVVPGDGSEEGSSSDLQRRRIDASAMERLETVDLRHLVEPDEIANLHALALRLARRMRAQLVRRHETRRHGRRIDLRRTIHRSVSHGGTPIELAWRRRKIKPLRLVVLLDGSGSMDPYTAFFVRFLHAMSNVFHDAEAFLFHTRLVHVSAALRDRDAARAVDRLALMAQGIGGGTRIGECLAAFNRWHGPRVINSRTAIAIVSDGYDTGEPERLAEEMRRLRRRCRRIIWLNPLIGWRDYAPEARGMQAALPYVDLFAPAHNLASLLALEPYLARI